MKKIIEKIIPVFLICFILTINCYSQWPQWRGPNRDGISTETGLLKNWPVDGPKLLWSVDSVGDGFSSTSVNEKIAYIIGKRDSVEIVTAINLNGQVLWQTAFGRAKKDNSWPQSRCTPTIYENKIYAVTVYGDVACLNAKTGEINWSIPLFESIGSIGYNLPDKGVSESPLIIDDKVILTPCGLQTTAIALNRFSGEKIWQTESLRDSTWFTSPLLIRTGKATAVFCSSNHNEVLVDPDSGKLIWKGERTSGMVPVADKNQIYFTGEFKKGGSLCQWNEDLNERSVVWTDTISANAMGGAVKFKNKLYVSGNSKGIFCLDSETGKVLSYFEAVNYCNLMVADNMLYSYEDRGGKISLFDISGDEIKLVSSFKINQGKGPRIAHLSIADGLMLVRRGKVLMAFDVRQN